MLGQNGIGGGLAELSQFMLLLICRCFGARNMPPALQVKPSPCGNGLAAASCNPHCIAPCRGQLPLSFPSTALFPAFSDDSSSDKICQK